MSYAELHCVSNFSFLRGASHPHELIERAASLGYQALALTDECSVAGVVRAHIAAKEHQIKLIVGSEFRTVEGLVLVVLAPTREAYGELCALITQARRRCEKGQYRVHQRDFVEWLSQCLVLWSPREILRKCPDDAKQVAAWLSDHFPERAWLLYERLLEGDSHDQLQSIQSLAAHYELPLTCGGDVHMHIPERQKMQHILCSIRQGVEVTSLGTGLQGNAERHLRELDKLRKLYRGQLRQETLAIAARCTFSLDELRYEYPAELVPSGLTANSYLAQLVRQGQARRFPDGTPAKIQAQIDKELGLIQALHYEYFFLTIYDVVQFAKKSEILHQGRGSAANSVVCYCLGITEVDPTKIEVLFERFISKERGEPPDIDVDFEHERREEVIQYIYQKYGRERAALAATVITFRFKSAVREVGKALGIETSMLEQFIAKVDRRDQAIPWQQQLRQAGIHLSEQLGELFLQLVEQIIGFPRHLSQHVGGFVISAGPLHQLVPVENAAMTDRTVIQWDKDDLEDLGLLKVDILALGMLTAIRKAFQLIEQKHGKSMSMARVEWEQAEVYDMLCRADSIGVFQIESRAQMNMLPRLKPRCYYDLVVQIAIVRPGPIQGDMVHPYLRRRNGSEPVSYPNQVLKQVLQRTLGVPLFQEQVIKLAMVAAGFTAGEADQLRRAMASWKRHGQLMQFHRKFIHGMLKNGYEQAFAEQVFRQIRGFGEYGFPESHSASFALLAYVSAWLKCHYPEIFCCALLNSQPMGFYSPSQLVQDAQRHQVEVLPVDINHSHWDHTLEQRSNQACASLRLGFRLIKGLQQQWINKLEQQRPQQGFKNLPEFIRLLSPPADVRDALASAGAFRALAGHRYQARWTLAGVEESRPLFEDEADAQVCSETTLPIPSESDNLLEDYVTLGLSLERHPLAILRERQRLPGCISAEKLADVSHGTLVSVAGLVVGRQRPGTSSGVTFITLEDETGNINVVVWLATARAQRQPYLSATLMKVKGILEREGDVIHIIAGKLEDLSAEISGLPTGSRDFR